MLVVSSSTSEIVIDQSSTVYAFYIFFQAEDGIRHRNVTGVQTCALPIYAIRPAPLRSEVPLWALTPPPWLARWPPTDARSGFARSSSPAVPAARPGEVLPRVRQVVRARHYSRRTEKAYAAWARRFLAFHHYRDPAVL